MIPRKIFFRQYYRTKKRMFSEDISIFAPIVENYSMGRVYKIWPAGDGISSKVFFVTSEQGKWVLKQYRPQIQPQAVSFIHSLLLQLEQQRFPASRVKLTRDGLNYMTMSGNCYAMFDYKYGYRGDWFIMPKSLRHLHIKQAGAALARFHRLTASMVLHGHMDRGYKSTGNKERWDSCDDYPDEWSELVARSIRSRDNESPISSTISSYIRDKIVNMVHMEKNRALLPISVIHGDYGPWNLLFSPLAVLTSVIDFDDVSLEERIEEVAASIIPFAAVKSENRLSIEDGRVFLESYHQEYPLTLDELRALPRMLERYLLKNTLVILRRHSAFGWKKANKKLHNIISWLDWLETSGIITLEVLTSSILGNALQNE